MGDVPPPWGGSVCLSAREYHKMSIFLCPTQTWVEGFPDPYPFFRTPQELQRCQGDATRRGEEETPSNSNPIKLQPVPPPQGSAMSPTPQTHPATGTAQRGDTRLGVIEPGSFIYTVKVTSNFLRLSCSSAIKSWRGRSSLLTRPRRGHLGQPLPGHARPAALVQLPARLGYYRS